MLGSATSPAICWETCWIILQSLKHGGVVRQLLQCASGTAEDNLLAQRTVNCSGTAAKLTATHTMTTQTSPL